MTSERKMIKFEPRYLYAAWDDTLLSKKVIAGNELYDDIISMLSDADSIKALLRVTGENKSSNYPFQCGDKCFRFVYADPDLRFKIAQVLGYIAGTQENDVVWHDLRKDPTDLPSDACMVLNQSGDKVKYDGKGHWLSQYVTAWCEIPRFEESTDD